MPFTPPPAGEPQVRTLFENIAAQNRAAITMEQTIASHSVYGAVSGISLRNDSRIGAGPEIAPEVCEEKFGQLWSNKTRAF